MMADRLKVGIIGGGAVSEIMQLPALTKLPFISIYALVDKNEERAKAIAEKFCLARYHSSYEALFKEIDIALIALPNHLHAQASIDFLRHDVHVLCEKPMATSVKECRSMIDACEKSKAKLMIGHNKRFMSNVLFLKKLLDNGSLGEITEYSCKVGSIFRWPTKSGFYFKKDEAGGGVLIDMGVHILDLLLWYFGDVESVSYEAKDLMGKGMEDNAKVSLTHKNSVKGQLTLSRTEKLDNKLLIKGDHGWGKIDMFDTTLFEYQSKHSKLTSEFGPIRVNTKNNDTYRDQFVHFVRCIRSKQEPLISGTEGMRVMEVVEKCYNRVSS